MTDEIDKILTRVKKLLAKAESAKEIGSIHEAEAFAEGAAKLLSKHKLDMSMLSEHQLNAQEPIVESYINWKTHGVSHRRKRVAWIEWLAGAVARGHFCRILVVKKSSSIYMVGRKSDAEVATYVLTTLVRAAEEQAEAGYWKARYKATKETGSWNTKGYKSGFFYGFVNAVSERLTKLRNTQSNLSNQMALVYVKSDKEIGQYIGDKYKGSAGSVKGRGGSGAGYRDGHAAGSKANLTGNGLKAGSSTSPKQIGG